jgi:tetratricopeptide (TPR) repeat protein
LTVVTLAETGHCREALPKLQKELLQIQDKDLKKRAGFAGVRCGMSLNDPAAALSFLTALSRDFPRDPAVLYLATHVYSDLSIRASEELLYTAPGSAEVHELNAESLEMQGKWKEAEGEYRAVLARDPRVPGIHYRLGRLMLSEPNTPPAIKEAAKAEFQQELKIDPNNAGAEFVLGELARQSEQWQESTAHFAKAVTLDSGFTEAYIGLGRSLLGANKPVDAAPPLETAAKIQPDNPEVHFFLATAYRRAGRKTEADREFLEHKRASEKAQQKKGELKTELSGGPIEKPPR